MGWYSAATREMKELLAFLRIREWSCVSFSSRLINREGGGNRILVNRSSDENQRIVETLLLTNYGLILPVIDPDQNPSQRYRSELLPLIESSTRHVHSIMGLDAQVRTIESILLRPIQERIDYFLMTREYFNIPKPTLERGPLKVRRASAFDVRALFPLQREYEKEEVLLHPERFNATASFLNLQKNLRHELVYVAEVDGIPVAKAGTNARGMNYYQIGGVYTVPSLRGRGMARAVMEALMWEIAKQQKHLCLFVKKSNPAAIQLYTKLGFTLRESYAITYYLF